MSEPGEGPSTCPPGVLPARQFASDNSAGVCPEVWEAMSEANRGHALAYGNDPWTQRACNLVREVFETDCEVFFVFNGTAANSLAIASLCMPYHSVICHPLAHLETDECGAPEFFCNGSKVLVARGENGKLDPASVEYTVKRRDDIHYPKPHALSITQATELGTVYAPAEMAALGEMARRWGLKVHVDGARLANALVELAVSPKEVTWKAGVDVLCLGGSKNGGCLGEAVIFFDRRLAHEFDYRCKQAGQLASKMRFLAAQWIGLLENGTWLSNAARANRSARRMEKELRQIPGLRVMHAGQANAVFVEMPLPMIDTLHHRGWHFYTFIGEGGARLMCSWDTTDKEIDAFVADVRSASSQAAG